MRQRQHKGVAMSNVIEYKPYSYKIGWSKLNKWYYGVEIGTTKKIANPQNLWIKYFTSSKYVKKFREENGEPDIIIVDKIFDNRKDALLYEEKYLKSVNAMESQEWLNRSTGGKNFYNEITEDFREKQRIAMRKRLDSGYKFPVRRGKEHQNYGKKWSDEQKLQMSQRKTGTKVSNISESERQRRSRQAILNGVNGAENMRNKIWVTENSTQKVLRINKESFDEKIYTKGRPWAPRKKKIK